MNKITWLHLSDWHQKGQDFDRGVIMDALLRDIRNREHISPDLKEIDLIFFTGDIAFSGKDQEYEKAVNLIFIPIFEALQMRRQEGWKSTFVVPGNHDFDRDEYFNIREKLSIDISNSNEANNALQNEAIKPAILAPFKGFTNFAKKYLKKTSNNEEPAFSYFLQRVVKNKKIGILGINSAWHCARREIKDKGLNDYGNLIIGEAQVHEQLKASYDCDFVIALSHHPFHWLSDFDRDLVKEKLTRHCNFILHGHEHSPKVNVVLSTLGEYITIPGGACYDRRKPEDPRYTNSYNFVSFDLDSGTGQVFLRKWNDRKEIWQEDADSFKNGVFDFYLTNNKILKLPEKIDAQKRLITRFNLALKSRFFEEMNLSINHTLEEINGFKLLRHEMYYSFKISQGDLEEFVWETYSDDRVSNIIDKFNLNILPLKYAFFEVNGKNIEPHLSTHRKLMFKFNLDNNEVNVRYKYILYLRTDDIYKINLGRFTKKFCMSFKVDNYVNYNFFPIGGFPDLQPSQHEVLRHHQIEVNELCFPDQGYLMQWYIPD